MIGLRIASAVPLAALAIAGCGGDDAPSREEFVKSAEAICADLEKQGDALAQDSPESTEEVVDFAKKARTTAEDAVARIGELEVPDGDDGEKASQWQDALREEAEGELIPALEELQDAAEAEDEQALLAAAQRIESLESTKSDELAREIGADGCSDGEA